MGNPFFPEANWTILSRHIFSGIIVLYRFYTLENEPTDRKIIE